jgi:hypothetical protein
MLDEYRPAVFLRLHPNGHRNRQSLDAPSLGAALRRISKSEGGLPASVTLPHCIFNTDGSVGPGQDAGFLGRKTDPWLLNARLTLEGYTIQEIDLPAEIDHGRLGAMERPRSGGRTGNGSCRAPKEYSACKASRSLSYHRVL